MAKAKKQTEKICGTEYTVGTKAWAIAKENVRIWNQIPRNER